MSNQDFKYCPMCRTPLEEATREGKSVQECPSCGYVNWRSPIPAVSILLSNDGKVLMLRRAKDPLRGYWVMPGGFISSDEDPLESAKRETREETGQEPIDIKLFDAYLIKNDPRSINLDIIYEGLIQGDVVLSQEHDAFTWHDPKKLPNLIAFRHREVIEKWVRKI